MIGARIGDYAIERELGSGGMGSVYLARSRSGRAVAIKVIRPEYAADPRYRDRFRKEVEAARRVGGFHTAAIVDADPDAPLPWMASAYIKGPTLADEIDKSGGLDEPRLWTLAAALAEALVAIHSCGLVHRDLKPGNIVLADDGPRVLDFGIARITDGQMLTSAGLMIGTLGFLSPEQVRGTTVTGASDVFNLGAVLVAAAGGSAFGQGTLDTMTYRALHEEADLSAVPETLRPVVEACLRKDPEQRPTARQLLDRCADAAVPAAPYTPTMADTAGFAPYSATTTPEPQTGTTPTATPTATPSTSTPSPTSAPTSAPAPTPAPVGYRHNPWHVALLVLRNGLILSVSGVAALATVFVGSYPPMVTLVAAVCAVAALLRLVAVFGTVRHRLTFGDAGIGLGAPDNAVVLPWTAVRSLAIEARGKETFVAVLLAEGRTLPTGFRKPPWVRTRRKGLVRIRTTRLAPVTDTPPLPLPEAVRTYAAQHGVPLTQTTRP
ncbi:serine/threonine-protein kinase [Streptomyces sp. NPDC002588]|uniref:serine/threonine-protein kinase n=1 Tax=Streptomyces sp. NPDC002588 TaxID=3154419 RepID=UPI00331F122F